jgi:hypothetical protein
MEVSIFDEDLLGLKAFAESLERFINVEHRFVSESLVISLNAGFGAGKTTFFKMWADSIKKRDGSNEVPLVAEVNAWNDDYCGDPFVSLVTALLEALKGENQDTQDLRNAAKDVAWFLTGLGGQVVSKFTGIDVVAAGELAEKKKAARTEHHRAPQGLLDAFLGKKEALQLLKSSIRKIVKGDKPSVLVLVDELDRCRPDYAISYLETIKHIFDIHGIVFVIAVDRRQLECSAKAAFGADLDFPEYYRKFVQREVALPTPNERSYATLASKYVEYYLQREGERYCFMSIDRHRVENIVNLISSMRMTPRQVQEIFRIMGHVLATEESNKGKLLWCLGVGTLLMSALRIGNHRAYEALGKSELSTKDAAELFRRLDPVHAEWWFTLCLTGGGLNPKDVDNRNPTEIYRDAGFISEGEVSQRVANIGQWHNGWGYSHEGRFGQIYYKIEQVSSWN